MSAKPSLRIALIGGLDEYHAHAFSKLINVDWQDEDTRRRDLQNGFPEMPADVKITAAWDPNPEKTERLASMYGIDHPCTTLEEALDRADAIIIPDDAVLTHHRWALPVMERRLPFFLDKPMAPSYIEAKHIVEQARAVGAVMFSSSALAFTRELAAISPRLDEEGGVKLAVAAGPNGKFLFYGIHPVTAVYSLFGPGIVSVQNTGTPGHHAVRFEWKSGRTGIFVVDPRVRGFALTLYTAKGAHHVTIQDSRYFYFNLLVHFVQMAVTGKIPVPWEHTLEIIRALETVEQAALRHDSSVQKLGEML